LQNYQAAFHVLPPGCVNPTGPIKSEEKGYHVSWIVQILPHLEQQNVYHKLDFTFGVYSPQNASVRQQSLPNLLCPSDGAARGQGAEGNSYAGNHHDREAPIDVGNNGVLFLNSSIRLDDVSDGTSHTIYVGEKWLSDGPTLGWVSGTSSTLRNGSGLRNGQPDGYSEAILTLPGSRAVPPGTPKKSDEQRVKELLIVGGFSSQHPGGFHVGLGDSSIRLISQNIDSSVFRNLMNRADGQTIGDY